MPLSENPRGKKGTARTFLRMIYLFKESTDLICLQNQWGSAEPLAGYRHKWPTMITEPDTRDFVPITEIPAYSTCIYRSNIGMPPQPKACIQSLESPPSGVNFALIAFRATKFRDCTTFTLEWGGSRARHQSSLRRMIGSRISLGHSIHAIIPSYQLRDANRAISRKAVLTCRGKPGYF